MAKNGDKLAFSFNLRDNPQRVAATENILGIVHVSASHGFILGSGFYPCLLYPLQLSGD